jgi:hypothetical protein
LALAIVCSLTLSGAASAQEAATDAAALAKAVQNPQATLVTLPLQANYNTGAGPYDRTLFNLNVQPVVPFPGDVQQNADGSYDVYFGPEAPAGKESNWVQTVPGKGWHMLFRFYGPEQAWFDKTWRPSEIEMVE